MAPLTEYVSRHGVPLIFGIVLVEQIGIPIPAIPLLVTAGALAVSGRVSAWQILAAAVVASLLADAVWYWLGRKQGHRILRTLCRISLSPDSCVRQTESAFAKWGMPSLLLAKFIPGFSTVAPPLAGAARIRPVPFFLFDAAGALLWAGSGIAAGMIFHQAVDRALSHLSSMGGAALVVVAGALAAFVAFKWWERRRFYKALRMARISVDELRKLIDGEKKPIVVDVRNAGARATDPRRIPGAAIIDETEIEVRLAEMARDREVVLYCT